MTGLWCLHSALSLITDYQVHLFILNSFRDMLQTKLLLQKLGREKNVITCDRVVVLALCTSSYDMLSMYQVLFNSLVYFQRYALDKPKIAKISKDNNSVNTGDRVMVLIFCDPLY